MYMYMQFTGFTAKAILVNDFKLSVQQMFLVLILWPIDQIRALSCFGTSKLYPYTHHIRHDQLPIFFGVTSLQHIGGLM